MKAIKENIDMMVISYFIKKYSTFIAIYTNMHRN